MKGPLSGAHNRECSGSYSAILGRLRVWTAPLLRVHFEHLAPCPEDRYWIDDLMNAILLVRGVLDWPYLEIT